MEYAHDESSHSRHGSDSNLQNSLDDSANNSIIGKVKSRVSSILPNRLSKWFSPSVKQQNDSLNGSLCGSSITLPVRRRRRIDVEEEENYEDEDVQRYNEYEEGNHIYPKQTQNQDLSVDDNEENDEDDDSQNSEEEYIVGSNKQTKRDLNVDRQPPAKRFRLNVDVRDSPALQRHQPLSSSTPAVGSAYFRNAAPSTSTSRSFYQRYTNLNLYGNQIKKEPAFNFVQQNEAETISKINTDIIDLITNSTYEHDDKPTEPSNIYRGSRTGISSRKSLNIPSSSTLPGAERVYATVAHLKRQPLSTAKADLSTTNTECLPPSRTSTTLQEVGEKVIVYNEKKHCDGIEQRDEMLSDINTNTYNGSIDSSSNCGTNKVPKLINGTGLNVTIIPESNEGVLVDSASESGESGMEVIKTNTTSTKQRKTGLFNMSTGGTTNTRNSSRASSFGNGLNFYSHLEGRKSLFNDPHHDNLNPLNNSTLSLTSLNRRQFNASIYGSTSALSDSRLLNTFSPFYKGKTTYGGAAAYNKYTSSAGASSVRITPTLIRPTSSLSTLSSSNNSLVNINSHGESSTISSTAKRILDLINDFSTPLSEAKKMASNLKCNQNLPMPSQAKGRLNDDDLNASRAVRLSHVRTPYSRPAVILQPSGNASGRGTAGGLLPPVKELQVPSMSQLLQMKKMQNITENSRKIAQNSDKSTVESKYTLPNVTYSQSSSQNVFDKDQQKHTNKIKNKMANTLRPSAASKDLHDEEPPPPVNLPNITFPLMKTVPKIDIQIKKPSAHGNTNLDHKTPKLPSITETSNVAETDIPKSNSFAFTLPSNSVIQTSVSTTNNKTQSILTLTSLNTFTFSEPFKVVDVLPPNQSVTKYEIDEFKFSSPLDVKASQTSNCFKVDNTQPTQPQLKEGSCLDVLSKPLVLPPISNCNETEKNSLNEATSNLSSGFGDRFKKSTNEWECDVCMIRNQPDINKCVACETPRKEKTLTIQPASNLSVSATTTTLGQQFKKSSNEWECDACLIRNKEQTTKCIACEAPRKCELKQSSSSTSLQSIRNSFGDAFKPKSGTWECQTCLISNKNEANECIACQTKKTGGTTMTSSDAFKSAVPVTQFKFGFAAADGTKCEANVDFKQLAAQQKASKWECDACMTRNDANRTKCACCEQPKPETTSTESTNTASTKFQFGATAASKFSFGFGAGKSAHKEEVLTTKPSNKIEELAKPISTELGTTQNAPAVGSFQFGIKSTTSSTKEKKDEIDSNKQTTGFKFGVLASSDGVKMKETSDISSQSGFVFGSGPFSVTSTKSATTMSSAAAVKTPSVQFNLPSATTSTNISKKDKPKDVTVPSFGFGSSIASSTSGGFSFGDKIKTQAAANVEERENTTDNNDFKMPASLMAPKDSNLVFGSSAESNSSSVVSATAVSSTFNTTASTAATTSTTATVKPMFSFGTNTSATSALSSKASSSLSTFSFGSNLTNNVAVATTTDVLLPAVASTSNITSATSSTTNTLSVTTSSTTSTTSASTNIFGSFGNAAGFSNAVASSIFGSTVNPPANNNLSTVSSSTNNPIGLNTSQFGAFGSKTTSNSFGSFGGFGGEDAKNSTSITLSGTKPTLPIFGNIAPNSTSPTSKSISTGFASGTNTATDTTVVTTALTVGSVTSTSTTWPKNSFVFGSTATATSSTTSAAPINENKEVAKQSVFGTFGTNSINQQQPSSIFGVPASNVGTPLPASGSTNFFGTNSTSAATSIFGANSSGNAVTPAPAFGSSPFGGAASSTSATPTFGSTAASGTTFGSFAGLSSKTITNTTEIKKPEAAFNFGAAPTAQSTSSGFNFGSTVSKTKPAFNFGGSSTNQQPTFNFTGTTEGTPNAPFQFNAGAAPVSSNIFAPAPTPGAQTAQQAKRKIRAPLRRVTQR